MSAIDDAFAQSRIDFGLKQKPNWNGTVYGVCMTKGCGNYRRIGYYEGGFCKKCSIRHPEDTSIPVLGGQDGNMGYHTTIPNPRIRWLKKMYVKDISHRLSGSERREFYMTPEQMQNAKDRIDYFEERWDENEGIAEAKPIKGKKKKDDDDDWYV